MMIDNPFKFDGPLDPKDDNMVLVPREQHVDKVVKGIRNGNSWVVLGSSQVGKTTFLFQIKNCLGKETGLYFDCNLAPLTSDRFFRWLMEEIQQDNDVADFISTEELEQLYQRPGTRFFHFLRNLKIKKEDSKSRFVFFFDNIDKIPNLNHFLTTLKKIYTKRDKHPVLKDYSFVVTASHGVMNSSDDRKILNEIAEICCLNYFSGDETGTFLDIPFKAANFTIPLGIKSKLKAQFSHPLMLQWFCFLLYKRAMTENIRRITDKDIEETADLYYKSRMAREILDKELKIDRLYMKLVDFVGNNHKGKDEDDEWLHQVSINGEGDRVFRAGIKCNITSSPGDDAYQISQARVIVPTVEKLEPDSTGCLRNIPQGSNKSDSRGIEYLLDGRGSYSQINNLIKSGLREVMKEGIEYLRDSINDVTYNAVNAGVEKIIKDSDKNKNEILLGVESLKEEMVGLTLKLCREDQKIVDSLVRFVEDGRATMNMIKESYYLIKEIFDKVDWQHLCETFGEKRESISRLRETFDDPSLGWQHKITVSIPFIPFLARYEAEISLGNGLNIRKFRDLFKGRKKEAWKRRR